MATFLHNGPCDACGSKDNAASYSDGSSWCWGCHKYHPPNVSGFVTEQQREERDEEAVKLPSDVTRDFPQDVVDFIKPYNLTIEELIRNDYLWSPYTSSLWRSDVQSPHNGHTWAERRSIPTRLLEPARGRFGEAARLHSSRQYPKASFYGSKESCFPICRPQGVSGNQQAQETHSLCLTEDSLSSLKVGRVVPAMPLFGTYISISKIVALVQTHGFQNVVVWLDHDMFQQAWTIADKFKWLGCGAKVVLTKMDPKMYDESFIEEQTACTT